MRETCSLHNTDCGMGVSCRLLRMFHVAAARPVADLAMLKYLRGEGYALTRASLRAAAETAGAETLGGLVDNGCPEHPCVYEGVARGNNPGAAAWAVRRGVACPPSAADAAAREPRPRAGAAALHQIELN